MSFPSRFLKHKTTDIHIRSGGLGLQN